MAKYQWCGSNYGSYNSLGKATEACKSDPNCLMVYDRKCDGVEYKLCRNAAQYSSGVACVYKPGKEYFKCPFVYE